MDRATIEAAIRICLKEARQRLDEAASVAKAAEACAEAGNVSKGIEVGMDIEQAIYEASRLFDAASLMNRLSSE
jgi:hypothetical protein